MKVNFTPAVTTSGVFEYKFEINQLISPTAYFKQVSLDASHGGTGTSASKIVYSSLLDFTNNTNSIATLTSTDGSSSVVPFPVDTYKTLWVRYTFTPGANGNITTLNNEYTQGDISVPGPLPVVGAGMAFGFSRKLRSRIKAGAKV